MQTVAENALIGFLTRVLLSLNLVLSNYPALLLSKSLAPLPYSDITWVILKLSTQLLLLQNPLTTNWGTPFYTSSECLPGHCNTSLSSIHLATTSHILLLHPARATAGCYRWLPPLPGHPRVMEITETLLLKMYIFLYLLFKLRNHSFSCVQLQGRSPCAWNSACRGCYGRQIATQRPPTPTIEKIELDPYRAPPSPCQRILGQELLSCQSAKTVNKAQLGGNWEGTPVEEEASYEVSCFDDGFRSWLSSPYKAFATLRVDCCILVELLPLISDTEWVICWIFGHNFGPNQSYYFTF